MNNYRFKKLSSQLVIINYTLIIKQMMYASTSLITDYLFIYFSVVGLNFDFLYLNIVGFALYGLFNLGLYFIPEIKVRIITNTNLIVCNNAL